MLVDYFTGNVYQGGAVLNSFDAPLWKLPVFVKSGSIIPMTAANNNVSEINKKLRIGAKLKFLFGVADGDVRLENLRADLSGTDKWIVSGKANAQVSMKGFTYKTSEDEYNNSDKGKYDKIDDVDVDGAGLSGFGMALDLHSDYYTYPSVQ